jgi:signal transduction histidine kinase
VRVLVEDDGRQPAPDPGPAVRGGHGLAGMRERVMLYGGRLSAGPRPEGGFRVDACFPTRTPPHPAAAPS